MQPTIDRFVTLSLNGSRFLRPKFVSSPKPPSFIEATDRPSDQSVLEWTKRDLAAAKECKSGSCKCAMGIVCRCGCKGRSHSTARVKGCHAITEYVEDGATAPPPPGVYA